MTLEERHLPQVSGDYMLAVSRSSRRRAVPSFRPVRIALPYNTAGFRGSSLDNSANRRVVEALVTRAYFQLVLVVWGEDGSRAASLAVHGNHEVRLIER